MIESVSERERERERVRDKERVMETKQEREVLSCLVNSWLMTLIPLSRGSSLPLHITCINMYV